MIVSVSTVYFAGLSLSFVPPFRWYVMAYSVRLEILHAPLLYYTNPVAYSPIIKYTSISIHPPLSGCMLKKELKNVFHNRYRLCDLCQGYVRKLFRFRIYPRTSLMREKKDDCEKKAARFSGRRQTLRCTDNERNNLLRFLQKAGIVGNTKTPYQQN